MFPLISAVAAACGDCHAAQHAQRDSSACSPSFLLLLLSAVTALKDSAPSPKNRPGELPLRSPRTSPLSLRSPIAGARASATPAQAPMASPDASPPPEAGPSLAWPEITLKPAGLAAALSTPIHSWFTNPTFHEPLQTLHSPGGVLPTSDGGGWQREGDASGDRQLFGGTLGGGAAAWLGGAAQPQAPQTPEPQEGGTGAPSVRGWQPMGGPGQGTTWDPPGSFAFPSAQPVQPPGGGAQAGSGGVAGGDYTGSSQAGTADGGAAREAQRVAALTDSFLRGGWEFADGMASDRAAAGMGAVGDGWQDVGIRGGHAGSGGGEAEAEGLSESQVEPSLHVGVAGDGDAAEDHEPWGSHGTVVTAEGGDAPGEGAWLPGATSREIGQGVMRDWGREDAVAGGVGEQDGGRGREEGGALQGVSSWVPGQQEQHLQQPHLPPALPQQQQLLATLQRQLEEMRARLEQVDRQAEHVRAHAERSAMESEALHAQRAAALEALQARTTVLEGRVRYLECELQVCVRRGEYDPHSHLPLASQGPQLVEGSSSPSEGTKERAALHSLSPMGRHNASLSSQQQQDLLSPNPVQSTPRRAEPAAWTEPSLMTSISRSAPHNTYTLNIYPHPPPPTANSATARTEAAATKHTPRPPATPSLHSVPSLLPSASLASPQGPVAMQAFRHTGSTAARQLWQGNSQSHTSSTSAAAAPAPAPTPPLRGSMRQPQVWQHHDQQQTHQQQRGSTSGSSVGASMGGSSIAPPVTPSLLAPMPSFSFQPSMPEHGTMHAEQPLPPHIAPPAAATHTADQQAGVHRELQRSASQSPSLPSNPHLMRDGAGLHGADRAGLHGANRAGLHGADRSGLHGTDEAGLHGSDGAGLYGSDGAGLHGLGLEASGPRVTLGGSMPATWADQSSIVGTLSGPAPADASSPPSAASEHSHGASMPPASFLQRQGQQQLCTPSTATPDTSSIQRPASMPSAAAGTSGTARTSHSSTSDLISSLYSRYTEAQSFLTALKSSKRTAA
ncbi:hypothetical protein DUNSADRAFT_5439 [Dunaliella salina]|uniref:Uncharacterized protein n=1 Tax=Dunaliella salina TaxID=3046 RepID=A0ABQ7GQ61_DUNSA|nr:hypothetical protein DUNSADRAFT_5439 [Dunaliella salina]|eukprot:KAF5836749.1 hypothetical protein DUNSADRAFT_5439 [Dunaliella salina]